MKFVFFVCVCLFFRLAEMKEQCNGEMGKYRILLSESQDTRDM